MHLHRGGAHSQLTRLHVAQLTITVTRIVPFLQLTVEESQQGRVNDLLLATLQHLLTSQDLQRAQLVLIEVVGIDLVNAEGSVTVASPTATQIELCEDAPDAIVTREDQSQGIVLTIRGVGESYLAQQWGEERAWGSQTVDAQGIVGSVLIRPFSVVDQSWRQGVQLEVTHPVAADHHRCILLVEGIHHLLQGLG